MKTYLAIAASLAALAPIPALAQAATPPSKTIEFPMIVSTGPTGASACLPHATGKVTDHTFGEFENLEVVVSGLPPNTGFDLFSIQVPNPKFGLAWYIGDIKTDATGTISSAGSISRLSLFPWPPCRRLRSSRNRPSPMQQ